MNVYIALDYSEGEYNPSVVKQIGGTDAAVFTVKNFFDDDDPKDYPIHHCYLVGALDELSSFIDGCENREL
jgi:hypothetical protein